MMTPRFTAADADRAYDEWGSNCGPGALAAIMHMTLDQVRPHLIGFDAKRYTNPTMMNAALRSIARPWRKVAAIWPDYGLVRVQWEGPWTEPGVPMRARYRYTHWIGAMQGNTTYGIFDINAIENGSGWCGYADWASTLVPHLTSQYPRAYGTWHITHGIEVEPPDGHPKRVRPTVDRPTPAGLDAGNHNERRRSEHGDSHEPNERRGTEPAPFDPAP